jgi:hypothetical protein
MGKRQLDAAILGEAREVTGRKTLRQKDIFEWSTGSVTVEAGEQSFYLPKLQINIVVEIQQ